MHCFSAKYTFPQNRNLQKPKLGLKRSRLQENALHFSKQSLHGFHSVQRPQDALKITHFWRFVLLFSPFINSSRRPLAAGIDAGRFLEMTTVGPIVVKRPPGIS